MPIHCFTSASIAYLDRVQTLALSIKTFHPTWVFNLCLVDREPTDFRFDYEANGIHNVIRLDDLQVSNSWIFKHDVIELSTAVKGLVLYNLLMREDVDAVIYLDPDIALFSKLTEVEAGLAKGNILLTPHQLEPENHKGAIIDNEIGSLKFGTYNLGFIAVPKTKQGIAFSEWWRDRLLEFCFDDVANGLFTDQKWCDLAPIFFEDVRILRHPGYNVASWNLSKRKLSLNADGNLQVIGAPLRFFHFTKVNNVGLAMIERYTGDNLLAIELVYWYRRELARNEVEIPYVGWWWFNYYNDGSRVMPAHRKIYRANPDLQEKYPNPFHSGDSGLELRKILEQSVATS